MAALCHPISAPTPYMESFQKEAHDEGNSWDEEAVETKVVLKIEGYATDAQSHPQEAQSL